MSFKIGIDVGGTFTDLFLWASDGRIETFKVLSTPADPSVGVIDGLHLLTHFGIQLVIHALFDSACGSVNKFN